MMENKGCILDSTNYTSLSQTGSELDKYIKNKGNNNKIDTLFELLQVGNINLTPNLSVQQK